MCKPEEAPSSVFLSPSDHLGPGRGRFSDALYSVAAPFPSHSGLTLGNPASFSPRWVVRLGTLYPKWARLHPKSW